MSTNNTGGTPWVMWGLLAAAVSAFLILPLMFALIVSAGALGLAWYLFQSANKSKESAAEEPPKPEDPVEMASEALLGINLELRKGRAAEHLLARYEALIDQILTVLPDVHSQTPGGDLAWAINRIATEYLPNKSVRPYLALAEGERAANEASVAEGLAGMESELNDIAEMVKNRKVSDFNGKAEFLRRRFDV